MSACCKVRINGHLRRFGVGWQMSDVGQAAYVCCWRVPTASRERSQPIARITAAGLRSLAGTARDGRQTGRLKRSPLQPIAGAEPIVIAPSSALRRLVVSFVLAMLAVVAVAESAHACLHLAGSSHGVGQHAGPAEGQVVRQETSALGSEASTTPDASSCSCACHGVASGLKPGDAPNVMLPRLDAALPTQADLLPPSVQPEGPRRPPRLS